MKKEIAAGRGSQSMPWIELFPVYTAGSAIGDPGQGGYATAWEEGKKVKTIVGGSRETTDDRMELQAVKRALEEFPPRLHIIIWCNADYVVKGMNERRHRWEKRKWKNRKGVPVPNADLWKAIIRLEKVRTGSTHISLVKCRGGDSMNERVRRLANTRARAGGRRRR